MSKFQLQKIANILNYNNLLIGNSRFTDDVWNLTEFIVLKTITDYFKKIHFSYIKNEDIKLTAKLYAYNKLGTIKPQTVVKRIISDLRPFIKYAELNNINSFKEINKEIFISFLYWLKNDYVIEYGKKKGQHIRNRTGYKFSFVVEEIIKLGQKNDWNVPQENIFVHIASFNFWSAEKETSTAKTMPIPEDIFNRILYLAVNKEDNKLTRAGIIIQSQTGLRISEVLSIQEGCVKTTSDGYDYMEVTLSKTEKGNPILHKVFINELVKSKVKELEKYTEKLRQESQLKELFLIRSNRKIVCIKAGKFNSSRLKKFIKKWNIRDNKGELYQLHSHQFRATYVRELIKRKIPIAHIMKHFDHVSLEMTTYYLTLQQEEVREIYEAIILNPSSKIAGLKAVELKDKLNSQFKGKTDFEIEAIIKNISKSMSFNPLPTGVCLYDFRRGNCSDGDGCFFYNCPNYVTDIMFYPILKKELGLMEKEMERFKELGRERDWQRQYVKHQYLKPLVDSLEVQVNDQRKAE